MSTMPPRRPHPDPGLSPSEWHTQELLLMREVMRGIGRSLAPALVLREMLHLMSELLGLNRGRIVLADPAPADWQRSPLDSMAVLQTPQGAAFDRALTVRPGNTYTACLRSGAALLPSTRDASIAARHVADLEAKCRGAVVPSAP